MNEDYVEYEQERKPFPWFRLAVVVLLILIVIVLIIKITKKGPSLYDTLLEETKTTVTSRSDFPQEVGDCTTYTLGQITTNSDSNTKKLLSSCDKTKTTVKVCKLDTGKYQYTPILSCKNQTTAFGDWKKGSVEDIKADNSDLQITYLGEVLETGVRAFYPSNTSDSDAAKERYASAPNAEYKYAVNEAKAYKWYTVGQEKVYYNNGEYTSNEPSGYGSRENEKTTSFASLTKPTELPYRNISSTTVYATENVSYPYKFDCKDPKYVGTVTSSVICEKRTQEDFKVTVKIHYTCDGVNEVEKDTLCKPRSEWTTTSCYNESQSSVGNTADGYAYTRQLWTGVTCISAPGFVATDSSWQWYKLVDVNKYYPSNATTAAGENTYYVNAPVEGATKDTSTEATTYQYYKMDASQSQEQNWVSISDESMTKEELINKFRELGHEISTISDINDNENLRYQLSIRYRNRK